MTRNLRAFGLALVAMLAFGAFAAQGASAVVEHSFRSDAPKESTVLTGQNESYSTGGSKHIFQATPGLTVECDATFEGTVSKSPENIVTMHPKYSSCGGGVSVHTGGCNYEFGSDTTEEPNHGSASQTHAQVSLECESPHSASPHVIEITRPGCNISFETTHDPNIIVNHSLHGVTYTNTTHSNKSTLTVKATVRTIKYTVTAGSFCGLAGHPAGTYGNGSYDGLTSVTGFEHGTVTGGSTTTGTSWSHGTQANITIDTPT